MGNHNHCKGRSLDTMEMGGANKNKAPWESEVDIMAKREESRGGASTMEGEEPCSTMARGRS